MDPNQPAIQSQRESLIPRVNQEAPLKELHDELLGLVYVLSQKLVKSLKKWKEKPWLQKFQLRMWNQGLNDPLKQKEIRNFVLNEDLKILGILETKVKHANEQSIFGRVFKNKWAFITNSNMDSTACFPYVQCFCCLAWGFNAIRYPFKKIGGANTWPNAKELRNHSIIKSSLDDISYSGCQFTWDNKQTNGHYIASKIDKVLRNDNWFKSFSLSHVYFCPPGLSNHSPDILCITPKSTSYRKPFKYFNFWADHKEFILIVRGVWCKYVKGSPMFRICCKRSWVLVIILEALQNKEEFSDLSSRVLCAKSDLESAQIKLDKDPMNLDLQASKITLCKKYIDLCKIQWLSLGDRNSSFFFRSMKNNKNRGRISGVTLDNGVRLTIPPDIHSAFVTNFSNLFGSPHEDIYYGFARVNSLINKRLTSDQINSLAKDVTIEEIIDVFKSLNPNQAPEFDGYSASFFQNAWDVVGFEVTLAIKSFFDSGELLKEINNTTIALVPKVCNPTKVGDHRPISCCNTIYKCIAKIIANRIKGVLPSVIDLVLCPREKNY
ncbi:hypothetical protein CsSME_00023980 [Camellia sinensis var. sinensis]